MALKLRSFLALSTAAIICTTTALTAEKAPIVLGSHIDLSGPAASWGKPLQAGMRLKLSEINAKGGVQGHPVVLKVEDSGYDPKKAALATQKLIVREKAIAIIGGLGTATGAAAMKVALSKKVAHLFPLAAADIFFKPHDPLKFALFTPHSPLIKIGVRYMAHEQHKQKFCVLYQDDLFGKSILNGTAEQLKALKLPLVAKASYKRGATDFTAQLGHLKAAACDVVVLGTVIRETVGVKATAVKMNWPVDMIASPAGYVAEVPMLGGAAMEGLYALGQTPLPDPDTATPALKDWMERYTAESGLGPTLPAAYGYLMMTLFEQGALAALKDGSPLTPDSLAKGIETIKDYHDIFGTAPISFSSEDHLAGRQAFVAQVQKGKWHRLTGFLD